MSKSEFNLPTIAGFVILTIILFMAVTVIVQQYIPSFRGIGTNIGIMLIFLTIAGIVSIMILKKEFSFSREEILPLIIVVIIIIAVIYFVPKMMDGTMFQQSAMSLSMFGK